MTAKFATSPPSALAAMDVHGDETAPEAFAPTPIYARATSRHRNNPAIWAIVLVTALAIGVGAYVMKTPKDDLLASTATPPASMNTQPPRMTQGGSAPTMAPDAPAKNLQTFRSESFRAPAARTAVAKTAPRKTPAARQAVGAETASTDASANIPAGPMPYTPTAEPPLAPVVAAPPQAVVSTPDPVVPQAPTPAATPQG